MDNVLDSDIVISQFESQSRDYGQFQTNTFGEKYQPPYSRSYGLNITTIVLQIFEMIWLYAFKQINLDKQLHSIHLFFWYT